MKITGLKCALIGGSPVIRIKTDEGIVGWGQIETPKPYLVPNVRQLEPVLLGQDPTNVERVVRTIRMRGAFKPWGAIVSAIEMALWDIAGKALGVPVYRLLGGKVRDEVECYRTFYHGERNLPHTVEGYQQWAEHAKAMDEGFRLFKLPTAFHSHMVKDFDKFYYGDVKDMRYTTYPHKGVMTERGFDHLVACITAAKEGLGKDYGLAVDAGPGFLPQDVIRLLKALEPLHLLWVEDTVAGDYTQWTDADLFRDITRATTTPVHTGEQIYNRKNFKALIEGHAVSVVGPDPCDVGGIAELKWVAEYAELHGIAMAPHGTANGIFGMAALVQVGATLPDNFIAFEFPARFEPYWYEITEGFDGTPVRNGRIAVPDRPGMGVELIEEAARPYLAEEDQDFFD